MPEAYYVLNTFDKATEISTKKFRYFRHGIGTIYYGGTRTLESLDPAVRLYLIAHGTSSPMVAVNEGPKKRWNATELAHQLADDGLSWGHRELELLICRAGASVNTVSGAKTMAKLGAKLDAATDEKTKEKIKAKVERGNAAAPPVTNYALLTETRLLPFAAMFAQAMKSLNYWNIQIYCYKYLVLSHFFEGKIWLRDGERE